ncbi:response regulator transcription factor [Natronosporangium hydrolyticum]|uniref:Response regulator transcription factor n=1 Tax=Natronosporangium hydrolyticum TaxID=2811111 RepID=A0A895Y9T1_9ACTN|nr:LuxR C-terminal-related transcriptional regulator [Natronosporangium hydrolyticum]QSB14524.1 response regulator transcription factor [Natronosporangium hydrolyticum]
MVVDGAPSTVDQEASSAVSARHVILMVEDLTDFDPACWGNQRVSAAVLMSAPLEEVGCAVDIVRHGGLWVSPGVLSRLASAGDRLPQRVLPQEADWLTSLTPRQRDVYDLALAGLSNEGISRRLQVAATTVRTHMRAILRKAQCANRRELLVKAAGRAVPNSEVQPQG